MLRRPVRIIDTQIMASLQNGTAFFASTSLFVIGGSLGDVITGDGVANILSGGAGNDTITVKTIGGHTTVNTGAGNDVVTVWNSSNTLQIGLGSVDLGGSDYVSGNATFGASGTVSSISMSGATVTVTLGTSNTASRTIAGSTASSMSWTPVATTTDRAGNACATTVTGESGAADREF